MESLAAIIAAVGGVLVPLVTVLVAILSLRQSHKTALELEALKDSRSDQTAVKREARQYAAMLSSLLSSLQRARDDLRDLAEEEPDSVPPALLEGLAGHCDLVLSLYWKELVTLPKPDQERVHAAKLTARTMFRLCSKAKHDHEAFVALLALGDTLRQQQSVIMEDYHKWRAIATHGEEVDR